MPTQSKARTFYASSEQMESIAFVGESTLRFQEKVPVECRPLVASVESCGLWLVPILCLGAPDLPLMHIMSVLSKTSGTYPKYIPKHEDCWSALPTRWGM